MLRKSLFFAHLLFVGNLLDAQDIRWSSVDSAWAGNSVNVAVFRKNSIVSRRDTQYVAFYDPEGRVVLGLRRLDTGEWHTQRTPYDGNIRDAHNSISIMVDGAGILHMAWNHHNSPLQYCRSTRPGALELTSLLPMTGVRENRVTYPEFFRLPDGNLLFFYRDGQSGQGNLCVNAYDYGTQTWTPLHDNLISGEGRRNAYWQACTDRKGVIHLSWVWRESADVADNHDLCYARSEDGGRSWMKSSGEPYRLPITRDNAEYACRIAPHSELINQTSMCADEHGRPYIAGYWKAPGDVAPQYRIVSLKHGNWHTATPGFRHTDFSLGGTGTKSIPISRPQIAAHSRLFRQEILLVFRDRERGDRLSVAHCRHLKTNRWKIRDLTDESLGAWEPSYDSELWRDKKILSLFVQHAEQPDAEGVAQVPAQPVRIVDWAPFGTLKKTAGHD